MAGRGFLVRYADALVIVLSREDDVRRVMTALPKRLGRFGLRPHPEKTRVVQLARPRSPADRSDASGEKGNNVPAQRTAPRARPKYVLNRALTLNDLSDTATAVVDADGGSVPG